jgi:hypothetical protein
MKHGRLTLLSAALALLGAAPAPVKAQASSVDPAATRILKRATDYLGSLKQYSLNTPNTLEDLLGRWEDTGTDDFPI